MVDRWPFRGPPMNTITHHLKISGMTCGGCSGRVKRVLESTPGVISAEVSHEANSGAILATEAVSKDELIATVINAGFTLDS